MSSTRILLGLVLLLAAPLVLLAGLFGAGMGIHEFEVRQLERDLLALPLPPDAARVAHGRAIHGPVSSNYCLLDAAMVVDLPPNTEWPDGPAEVLDDPAQAPMPGPSVAADLAAKHPPAPNRRYVALQVHDATSFAFHWDLRCH